MLAHLTPSHAAGFALIEQSGSGLGNAFAGGAAGAEDASTIFFNPAGMTYLPDNQLVIAAHAIRPSADFNDNGSHHALGILNGGGDGGDAGGWAFVPNFYFARAISENVRIGIGVNAPFGLKTEYDKGWVGRYQALKSDLKTININPSIAFKASDTVSLGFGISAMRAKAELTNAVDFGTLLAIPHARDGKANLEGDDWGWGWNAGALFQVRPDTRIGLAYRSQVHQTLDGTIKFSNVPAPLAGFFPNGDITAKLTTPDSFSVSAFHQANDRWDVMGDLTWTHWSKFDDLTAVRPSGTEVTSVPENWENSIRASLGASYRYNEALKARAGIAFDESPVPSKFRTPRIPDNDRYWLSLGANYKCSQNSSLDVGFTHIIVKDPSLNKTTDASVAALRDTIKGDYDNNVNILSVQYTYSF